MTDTELSAIRARCEAATPGPWRFGSQWDDDVAQDKATICVWTNEDEGAVADVPSNSLKNGDLNFVIHARTDIPALLERIDEQKEALARATAQNAVTLAEHTMNFIQGLADAVTGADEKTTISMKFTCPYCHKIMDGAEEAREHDATCESHPAVIRAIKSEADKAALVFALESLTDFMGDTSPEDATLNVWILALAALASAKGDEAMHCENCVNGGADIKEQPECCTYCVFENRWINRESPCPKR